jgi:disulfide bond formation protein DsbB
MTVTDIRPSNSIEFGIENQATTPGLGEIVPGEPVYMVPDNPWMPWTDRAAGGAIGAWLASAATVLLNMHMLPWAVATSVAVTLLFAWVMAGHELYERNPRKFKKAP